MRRKRCCYNKNKKVSRAYPVMYEHCVRGHIDDPGCLHPGPVTADISVRLRTRWTHSQGACFALVLDLILVLLIQRMSRSLSSPCWFLLPVLLVANTLNLENSQRSRSRDRTWAAVENALWKWHELWRRIPRNKECKNKSTVFSVNGMTSFLSCTFLYWRHSGATIYNRVYTEGHYAHANIFGRNFCCVISSQNLASKPLNEHISALGV